MIKKNNRKGFTLIEVAIALALAAAAMVSTYQMISQGLRMQRQAVTITNAVFLAKIKMTQLDSAPKLETTSSEGDIPGYTGYRFKTEIKEEEMDLLKLAEQGGEKKKKTNPEDLLGTNPNAKMDEYMKKRGKAQGAKTAGLIKVYRVKVTISYPEGNGTKDYVVETIKSTAY